MMAKALRAQLIRVCLLFLFGCAAPSSWTVDHISAGDPLYDSSRIRYISKQAHPILFFEITQSHNQVQSSIFLNRFRFEKNFLTIEGICNEIPVDVHEGKMRIKLDEPTTKKIIQALQEGRPVGILIDGFEETLDPKGFSLLNF